jgi:hypothetical protein
MVGVIEFRMAEFQQKARPSSTRSMLELGKAVKVMKTPQPGSASEQQMD